MDTPKSYYAFISYKREDEQWAEWLQHKLEHYRLPANLNGRTDLPREIRPVFKDTSELIPGNLPRQIREALEMSRYLIVICSPRSAASEWVNREVEAFIGMGRNEQIIPFIIEGKPFADDAGDECFPLALRALPSEQELLGADVNEQGRDAAAVKVVARMFDIQFDVLWQRYEREQRRRRRLFVGGLLGLLVFFGCVSCWMWQKNRRLAEQNDIIFHSTLQQDIALSASYLYQGRVEKAIVALRRPDANLHLLDSAERVAYERVLAVINDSLSVLPVVQIGVRIPSFGDSPDVVTEMLSGSRFFGLQPGDVSSDFVVRSADGKADTLFDTELMHFAVNASRTHMAVYDASSCDDGWKFDTSYAAHKGGIHVYSLSDGRQTGFVRCGGWYPWMSYPIALDREGLRLVYREGWRERDDIWCVDFRQGTRVSLKSWRSTEAYQTPLYKVWGAYSPDDAYYYIHYEQDGHVELYAARTNKLVHEFCYEVCDTVCWDKESHLCITSGSSTYVWAVKSRAHSVFHVRGRVCNVALSADGQKVAALCDDGRVCVWNVGSGKCLWQGHVVDSPDDLEFTPDGKALWIVTGYNGVAGVDLEAQKVFSVKGGADGFAPHHWSAYIHFTSDGRYAFTYFSYENVYKAYDVDARACVADTTGLSVYFHIPERVEIDENCSAAQGPLLTARKESAGLDTAVEGYSDGTVRVVSVNRFRLFPGALEAKF